MLWVIQQNTSSENLQRALDEVLGLRLVTAFQNQIEPLRQEMLSSRLDQNEQHDILISKLHDQNHHIKLILEMLCQYINNPTSIKTEAQLASLGPRPAIEGTDQVIDPLGASRERQNESSKSQVAKEKLQELYTIPLCSLVQSNLIRYCTIFLYLGYFLRDILLVGPSL
jgi:hypothetical protein